MFPLLADRLALDGSQRALDLGTGTGALALPLAELVAEVIAVDPEPGMPAEGRRLAADRGTTGIDWRLGGSRSLTGMGLPPLDLVTMGASFHWMDRDQVLRDLDRLLLPGGAVVLAACGADHDDIAPPAWQQVVAEVRTRYLGPVRRAGSGTYSDPEKRHEPAIARSAFTRVETAQWDGVLRRTLDEVVGYQFSLSCSSPAQLGSAKDNFERELRQAPGAHQPDGHFDELIRTDVLIARRS